MIIANNVSISFKLKSQKSAGFIQDRIARFGRNHTEKFWALRGVTFRVNEGETLGIIGANGSGKSTLLRVLAGIYTPHEGSITVNGKVSTLLSTTAGFQADLTGIENIYMNGVLTGLKKERIDELLPSIIEYSGLGDFVRQPVRTYSSGMYARLGFSIAIHAEGDILLVDEVLGAGDAEFAEKAKNTMEALLKEGRTVVLVSHGMEAIRKFASKVLWLDHGKVMMQGNPDKVISSYLEMEK